MGIPLQLGLGAIRSFRRLSYTPWYALAEFVDNSTESYHDHREELDAAYELEHTILQVVIDYGQGVITVTDNAIGMSLDELKHALAVGEPPTSGAWRSRYGFGLKTAASWFGDLWIVETKRLGAPTGYRVTVDVEAIAGGNADLTVKDITDVERDEHFTRITIEKLNRPIRGHTVPRVKEFLGSMYRQDIESNLLSLVCFGERLDPIVDHDLAVDEAGQRLYLTFDFTVNNKRVHGWAGVLAHGGRPKAGFSILHAGRVVKGPPAAWRPTEIFGQIQGTNNLVNQRIVGEVVFDDFEVSHTKDDILWLGDEQEEVQAGLKIACADLISAANRLRKPAAAAPSGNDLRAARARMQEVLASPALRTEWLRLAAPPTEELEAARADVVQNSRQKAPSFTAHVNGVIINGYLDLDTGADQEYAVAKLDPPGLLSIVINLNHPHVMGMKADVLVDHLKHCVYDAMARLKTGGESDLRRDRVEMATFFKDALLRLEPSDELTRR